MEENKVFVPQPPKELRQSQAQEEKKVETVPELTKVEEKVKKPKNKIKINWDSIVNWFGLLVSVAAVIVFVYLLAK